MKTAIILSALLCTAATAMAGEYVKGYTKRDGTYVQGYYRSSPDSSYNNNYSTRGNINPYSGQSGTEPRTWNNRTPQYNERTYGNSFEEPSYNDSGYNTYGR